MHTKQQSRPEALRYKYEFLLSLNIALSLKLVGGEIPGTFTSLLAYHESPMKAKINAFFNLNRHSYVGGDSAFLITALVFTFCIFLLLRILGRMYGSLLLLHLSGLVSVSILPVSWLYLGYLMGGPDRLSNLKYALLIMEVLVVMTCTLLYLYDKWLVPPWGSIALLILHFGFWNTLCFGPLFWRAPFLSLFALAGFFSSSTWGMLVLSQKLRTTEDFAKT